MNRWVLKILHIYFYVYIFTIQFVLPASPLIWGGGGHASRFLVGDRADFQIQDLKGLALLSPCCGPVRDRHVTWAGPITHTLLQKWWKELWWFLASIVGGVLTPIGPCCSNLAMILAVWSSGALSVLASVSHACFFNLFLMLWTLIVFQ